MTIKKQINEKKPLRFRNCDEKGSGLHILFLQSLLKHKKNVQINFT
jgi:hypothetical protein